MPFVLRKEDDTENPALPLVYGSQSTSGRLVFYTKRSDGRTCFISILGEGVMDGVDEVRYNGGLLQQYNPETATGQYVFHSGTLSTGFTDPLQGRPVFFPDLDFTFSGIAYIEVQLDVSQSEHEEEPSKLQVNVRGKRIRDFDATGVEIPANYGFSANNARVFADVALNYMKLPAARIDWPSWVAYRDRCDEAIAWAEGNAALTGDGLLGSYYPNDSFSGPPTFTRVEPPATHYNWDFSFPEGLPGQPFSVRWTGFLEAQYTETHSFYLLLYGAGKVVVNGETIIDAPANASWRNLSGSIALTAGVKVPITVEFNSINPPVSPAGLNLEWSSPTMGMQNIQPRNIYSYDRTLAPRITTRYNAHVVFPTTDEAINAVNAVFIRSPGCDWQDVNGKVTFIVRPDYVDPEFAVPGDRQIVHDFVYDPTQGVLRSNIIEGSFQSFRRNDEDKPNYLRLEYRDLDDPVYTKKYVYIDRPELRDRLGGQLNDPGIIALGVTSQSLADRIGESMMRVGSDLDLVVTLKALGNSHALAKGDIVRVSHDVPGWRQTGPVYFMVSEETFESGMETADERTFTLLLYTPDYYSDTDHGRITSRIITDIPSPIITPPQLDYPTGLTITLSARLLADGGRVAMLVGSVSFPAFQYPLRGRVWWKRPGGTFLPLELLTPDAVTRVAHFEIPVLENGHHVFKVVTENLAGRSRAFDLHPEFPVDVDAGTIAIPEPGPPTGFTYRFGENGTVVWDWDDAPEPDVLFWRVYNGVGALIKDRVGSSTWSEPPSAPSLTRTVAAVNRSGAESDFSATVTVVLSMPAPTDGLAVRDPFGNWRITWNRGERTPDIISQGEEAPQYQLRIRNGALDGPSVRDAFLQRPAVEPARWGQFNIVGFPCTVPATSDGDGNIYHPGSVTEVGCIYRSQVFDGDAKIRFETSNRLPARVISLINEDESATGVFWDTGYIGQIPSLVPQFQNDAGRRPLPKEVYSIEIRRQQAQYFGPAGELLWSSDELPITQRYYLQVQFGLLDGEPQELRLVHVEGTKVESFIYTAEMQVRDFGSVQSTLYLEIFQRSQNPSVQSGEPLLFVAIA